MKILSGVTIGHYQILEQLGSGGMAVVYEGVDKKLERRVAIKVIEIDPGTPEKVIKQFEKESRALARLNHPNIIPILDYGKSDNSLYLVMPLIEGGTLKDRMGSRIVEKEAAELLAPIARALAYAHEQNIIHRDVKPSNILISSSGTPMLSDFGIAKVLEEAETVEMTGTMQTTGTPEYMSPESGLGQTTTAAADIYSLGVILFEAITGKKPFMADGALAIVHKQAYDTLPRPSGETRGVPRYMDGVIYKAMAKDPSQRYTSMGEFAEVLEEIAAGKRVRVVAARPRGEKRERKGRRARIWIAALIGLGGLACVVYLYMQDGGKLAMIVGEETATLAPSMTQTQTATNTPEPTPSPTPTMTPTIAYPVDIGTPYPTPEEAIAPANIDRLTLLAQGGYGVPLLVSYSMDDTKLYVCTKLGLVTYNTSDYSREAFVEFDINNILCAYSPSTYLMAIVGADSKIRIWDMLTNSLVKEIPTKLTGFSDLIFSPSGNLIVTRSRGSSNSIGAYYSTNIWDIETGKIKAIIPDYGSSAALTVDEENILFGNGQYINYWNIARKVMTDSKFISSAENIHISSDGSLLINIHGGDYRSEGKITLYNFSDLKLIRQVDTKKIGPFFDNYNLQYDYSRLLMDEYSYDIPERYLLPFAILEDNSQLALGNVNGSIIIVNIDTGTVVEQIDEKWTGSIDFSNSGNMLAYTSPSEGLVKVYNLKTQEVITLANYARPFTTIGESILLMTAGHSIFGQNGSDVHYLISPIWGDVAGMDETSYRSRFNYGYSQDFSKNHLTEDTFWNSELQNSKTGIYMRFIISSDNKYMATTDGFSVELWKKPEPGWVRSNPTDRVATRVAYYIHGRGIPAFSNDSQYFADMKDSVATVWRLSDFTPVIEIKQTNGHFQFSRDSQLAAWITKNNISFFSTKTGELISTISIDGNPFIFSPQMDLCAVMKEQDIEFFSVSDGSLKYKIPNIKNENSLFDFDIDQKNILIGNPRGMVEIWGIISQ